MTGPEPLNRTPSATVPQPHSLNPAEPAADGPPDATRISHGTGAGTHNPQVEVEGLRPSDHQHCTDSVSGHAQNDRSGLCGWCGFRVDPPVPMPRLGATYRTELDLAYRQFYDPDWGAHPLDV